jgi:ribonuclease T2
MRMLSRIRRVLLPSIPLLLLLLASLAAAIVSGQPRRQPLPQPNHFSYYLLSLSWSPQYCWDLGGGAGEPQCDPQRRFGFVVHGLWPQNESGPNPRACQPEWKLDPRLAKSMLDLMPSEPLVNHEWGSHGTCSGLGPKEFFQLTRAAAHKFRIPAQFQNPDQARTVRVSELRKALIKANPGLPADGFALYCDTKALREVRVCFDKQLGFRSCGAKVHDACALDQVLLRATR